MNLANLGGFRASILAEQDMHFSLKYEGELKSSNNSKTHVRDKSRLRWHFSDQLDRLLKRGNFERVPRREQPANSNPLMNGVAEFSGITFLAVLDRSLWVACSLAIRIDRPERPGFLINSGDLDNRVKTIFDALRMPHNANEVAPDEQDPPRRFCCCLFEDDSMVTELSVSTHPSLEKIPKGHVKLNVDVHVTGHHLHYDAESDT